MRALASLFAAVVFPRAEAASYTEVPSWTSTFEKDDSSCILMGQMKDIDSPLWLSFRGTGEA